MRVVIADDVFVVRTGIATLLRSVAVEVAAECGDARSLLRAVAETSPDAAIVDIRMPPGFSDEGLQAARRIRSQHPGTAVLVLSQYLDAVYAQRLLADEPGRLGYLLKEKVYDVAVLDQALRRIVGGGCVIDDAIVARLVMRSRSAPGPLARLTPREAQVLGLMAQGDSNAGIAAQLQVAEKTVEASIASIFRKLDLAPDPAVNRRVLAVRELLRA